MKLHREGAGSSTFNDLSPRYKTYSAIAYNCNTLNLSIFIYGGADKLLMKYIPLGKRAQRVGWAVIVITQLFLLGKLAVMMIRKELFIYSAI